MAYRKATVESLINGIADRILRQSDRTERTLTNSSVTLRKRLRNRTDSDRFGIYATNGMWVDTFDMSQLNSLNITTSTIRVNTSVMIMANVKIDIQPRFLKDAQSQMAAEVARAILEQKERQQWTTSLEEQVAQEQQVGAGVFIRTQYNPYLKRKHSLLEWEDVEVEMPGSAVCTQCGQETQVTGEVEEQIECEACGGLAMIEQMPQNQTSPVPAGQSQFSTGDTETTVHPFFEFRIDDENTEGGNLEKARWFEHHYPVSLDELQLEYPESAEEIQGAAINNWSYPIRWQQILKKGWHRPSDADADMVIDQREVRDIYITPSMYLNVEIEQDFALKDKDGKERFSVKAGGTLADAMFEGEPFDEPPTLCCRVVGTSLLDVYPSDFKEKYFYLTFLSDPSAFWGLFLTDLTILQDMVNQVLTIQMYHIKRNAITSIVYNRSSFDPEAFEEDLIPTKEDIPPDIPIGQQFGIIPALHLSGEPMQMLGTIMELQSQVTGKTDAMMGVAQPNEPYAAQALQKQSSLGLLAPAEISKASAKVKWASTQLTEVQKHITDEDAEELLKLNSDWNEDHIAAFEKCNLKDDLIITYVQGSEVPESLIEREVKLRQTFTDIMGLAQAAPQLVQPEMINEVFSEIVQSAGLEIDFNDAELNLRLAEARYDKLVAYIDQAQAPEQIAQIIQLPDFTPFMGENYDAIIDFYRDKALGELAGESPNFALVTALEGLISIEQQGATMQAQQVTAMQMAAQMPAVEAQQQEQQGAMEAQAMAEQEKIAAEDARTQAEREHNAEMEASKQQHEKDAQILGMIGDERQREHDAKMNKAKAVAK